MERGANLSLRERNIRKKQTASAQLQPLTKSLSLLPWCQTDIPSTCLTRCRTILGGNIGSCTQTPGPQTGPVTKLQSFYLCGLSWKTHDLAAQV